MEGLTLTLHMDYATGEWTFKEVKGLTNDPVKRLELCRRVREAATSFHLRNSPRHKLDKDLDVHQLAVLRSLYEGVRYPISAKNIPYSMDSLIAAGYVGIAERPFDRWTHECYVPINALPPEDYHPGIPPRGLMT